jgi:hypothetical protein
VGAQQLEDDIRAAIAEEAQRLGVPPCVMAIIVVEAQRDHHRPPPSKLAGKLAPIGVFKTGYRWFRRRRMEARTAVVITPTAKT